MTMRRGEVWWAELPGGAGTRPVVLLSRDKAIQVRDLVTVAHVTTKARGLPTEVLLSTDDGLPRQCAANLDVLNTIFKSCLKGRICTLSHVKMDAIGRAARFALALE